MRWQHEELPWDAIDRDVMADDRLLFYLLATASFIEITTDLYTRNLIEYYAGNDEVQDWLAEGWEPEELQHGKALRRYVQTVWPEFNWEGTYRRFFDEYQTCCKVELLDPTPALEMARRCIVETGTCSYYTMIGSYAPCRVLKELTDHIRKDEAGHYHHFHDHFLRYREDERPGRGAILKALVGRIREIDGEDGFIAFKYVWQADHPGGTFHKRYYTRMTRLIRRMAVDHYPFRIAAHMMSQPLGFRPRTQSWVDAGLSCAARFFSRLTGTTRPLH